MKFQIVSIAVLILVICHFGNAFPPIFFQEGSPGVGIGSQKICRNMLNSVIMRGNKEKLLSTSELDKKAISEAVEDAKKGCENCESLTLPPLIAQCSVVNMKTAMNKIDQITSAANPKPKA